jgi:hypothetical protein
MIGPFLIRRVSRAAGSGFLVLAVGAAVLGGGSLGCGAAEQEGPLPLITIAECEQMEGAPLFDPEDERPLESSCPDGLEAIAEFDEDFYGSRGGICCTNPETEPTPADELPQRAEEIDRSFQ